MRRLFIGLIVMAILWSGWWALGALVIERGVSAWVEMRRMEGWQASIADTRISGFPTALNAALIDVDLTDPSATVTTSMKGLDLHTRPYWPFRSHLALPATPITFETAQETYALGFDNAIADLSVRPGLPLQLNHLRLSSPQWSFATDAGSLFNAQNLSLVVTQDPATAPAFRTRLSTDTLAPEAQVRTLLGLPSDWPVAFETFLVDITLDAQTRVVPDAPEMKRTRLRSIALNAIDLKWGDLHLTARGTVSSDANGVPQGQLTLLIKNWRQAYDIISQNVTLKAGITPQADLLLNGLSNIGGDPETLDLTLVFRDGAMFLGPIPLGPAPRLIFEGQRQ